MPSAFSLRAAHQIQRSNQQQLIEQVVLEPEHEVVARSRASNGPIPSREIGARLFMPACTVQSRHVSM
jgi:hypothetical protein